MNKAFLIVLALSLLLIAACDRELNFWGRRKSVDQPDKVLSQEDSVRIRIQQDLKEFAIIDSARTAKGLSKITMTQWAEMKAAGKQWYDGPVMKSTTGRVTTTPKQTTETQKADATVLEEW